jgi:succinate dehydrogenase / fumarate reductase membrane anchor subunit
VAEMIDRRVLADPQSHYGDARASTRHFIVVRLTGLLNVVLTVFLIWLVVRLAHADHAEVVAVLSNWVVAALLALSLISAAWHMRIGMADIIEDYADEARTHRLAMGLNWLFVAVVLAAGLAALAKIVIWG